MRSSVSAMFNIRLFTGTESEKEISGCSCPTAAVRCAFFAGLTFLQQARASPEGYAHFTLSGDYYNRALSGQYLSICDRGVEEPPFSVCLGLFLHKVGMRERGWGWAGKDETKVTA